MKSKLSTVISIRYWRCYIQINLQSILNFSTKKPDQTSSRTSINSRHYCYLQYTSGEFKVRNTHRMCIFGFYMNITLLESLLLCLFLNLYLVNLKNAGKGGDIKFQRGGWNVKNQNVKRWEHQNYLLGWSERRKSN